MRILLSNDDGIHAPGLVALESIARQLSDDIWIVAPETDQSGLAHSLTLHDPLRLRQIDERRYAVSGTPTDCVIMAVRHLMPEPPDLVLSGVNHGTNIADDVTYSGTVAVAIEATLLGIPAIALSQGYSFIPGADLRFDAAVAHGADVVRKIVELGIPRQTLMNVNFPDRDAADVQGVAVTRQGSLSHGLKIDARVDNRQRSYFWLTYGRAATPPKPGTDHDALSRGLISVTPLHLDMTDTDGLDRLRAVFGG